LDEIFADELAKVDTSFLTRMKHSWVSQKDEQRKRDPFNLFIEENYNDIDFYNEYPTIFHLRKKLIESSEKHDLRLIYLAIHNIVKYRGNFTFENQNFDLKNIGNDFSNKLSNFFDSLNEFDLSLDSDIDYSKLSTILLNNKLSPSSKVSDAIAVFKPDKDQKQKLKNVLTLIVGNKADLIKVFDLETTEKVAVKLSSRNIESELPTVLDALSDEQQSIIDAANSIYSAILLKGFLGDESYLSMAKVQSYEDHRNSLKELKVMWNETSNTKKDAVKKNQLAYNNYINKIPLKKDKGKHSINERFYMEMNNFLKNAQPAQLAERAQYKISINKYLLKQRTADNTVIPYQLNEKELIKILDNQSEFYPFLKENREKILSLINFRIPYYVGPIVDPEKSRFAWMTRSNEGAVRPWNFSEKINVEQSSNDFIQRMRSTDTYLIGEPVLPKQSLIYQKYEVLSELNNIRVGESNTNLQKLDVEVKQNIFKKLFKTRKTVSTKILKDWLIEQGYFKSPVIKGLSDPSKFLSSLSTYNDFAKLFGTAFVENPKNLTQLEELAEWLTLFEDKKILLFKLSNSTYEYDKDLINKIATMRYKGTGKLSYKLLVKLQSSIKLPNSHDEKSYSILDLMWETQNNFMQIIHDKRYGFDQHIEDYNQDSNNDKTTLEMIDDLHCSPALKRGINQSSKIVEDIVKFMGHEPTRIFLEFTRDDEDSNITESRYKRIKKQYEAISDAVEKIPEELKNLLVELNDNQKDLADERLMLYFLQRGHSLYSNMPIDIEQIHTSKYHVDHILPQSYIKDDSLENKALVLAEENENKINNMLIDKKVISANINRWKSLKEQNLMGPKKFNNLTRKDISENQKKGFVNRQLVQTSQMVKNVTNILNSQYKNTECIETRAKLSHSFRDAFSNYDKETAHFEYPEFVKSRDINDFHHAQDAYIAAIIGQYQLKKYPKDNLHMVYGEYSKFLEDVKKDTRKKNGKMPKYVQNGFIIGSMFNGKIQANKDGEIIWDQQIKDSIRKAFNFKQFNIVRQPITNHGALYKQTIWSPKKRNKLIPLKKGLDPSIYGGYSDDINAYSVLLDIDGKKKLLGVPVRIANEIKDDNVDFQQWLENSVKYKKNLTVLISKVPMYQRVINKEKGDLLLTSAREIINNKQLFIPYEYTALLKLLSKANEERCNNVLKNYPEKILVDIYEHLLKKMEIEYPFYPGELSKLSANVSSFESLSLYNQNMVLQEFLNLLHANSMNAKFKFGTIKNDRFGRKNSGAEFSNSTFVYESPTGLFKTFKEIK
jgi:CRISPR-associated endonuclease Csn1